MLQSASIKRMVNEEEPRVRVLPPSGNGFKEGCARQPSLIERASHAASELLGETYGQLIYSVLMGVKNKQMGQYSARLLLERCLPETRPTPVQLPIIDTAHDLVEADRRLMAAANVGAISHREWRQGQQCIEAAWRIRQQARLEEP
jgi:hypothetical protein